MTAQAEGRANPPDPLMCSVAEAARLLGLGRTYVYRLIAKGEIDSVKVGTRRLVPRDAIDGYIERMRADQSAQPGQRPRHAPDHNAGHQPNRPHHCKP